MMDETQRGLWLAERAGRLTASNMAAAMDFLKTGKPSAARTTLLKNILAERMTDESARHYVSPAMEHGLAYEDEAKMAYETATGTLITDPWTVSHFGIFHHPRIEYFAASPDGCIDDDGLIETKCPQTSTHLGWLQDGVVPEQHKPQMLAQLACSGRKWCEFVSYDPRIKTPHLRLFIRRFTPTAEELANVEAAASQFLLEVDRAWELLHTVAA